MTSKRTLAVCAVLLFVAAAPPAQETFTGKCVGVSDGDTIKAMRGGKAVKVRLYGIDCPERRQAFGTKAKEFTSARVFGKQVQIVVRGKDRYGRTVANIILPDGRSLSHEFVKAGLAWWYRKYAPGDKTLAKLEQEAREAKRGLWTDQEPVPPWGFRRQQRRKR